MPAQRYSIISKPDADAEEPEQRHALENAGEIVERQERIGVVDFNGDPKTAERAVLDNNVSSRRQDVQTGAAAVQPAGVRYQPRTASIADVVERLARAYEQRPTAVMKAIAAGKELEEMDLSEFGEDVYEVLSLERTLGAKSQIGGTARQVVAKQLTAVSTDLENDQR